MKIHLLLTVAFLMLITSAITAQNCPPDFSDFPWLADKVNVADCCNNQKVIAYPSGAFTFIFIEKCRESGFSELYFQDGTFYCSDQINGGCRAAYNLSEETAQLLWDCSAACEAEMPTETEGDDVIFRLFPWVTDHVNTETCNTSSITVYQAGAFNYLLITGEDGSETLYFENGNFYCQQTATYDCVTAYNLTEVVATWTCGVGGVSIIPDCSQNTGTYVETACSDGTPFIFIRTPEGDLLDLYFAAGVNFSGVNGQAVNYDFVASDIITPCTNAAGAITVTCIEAQAASGQCSNYTGTFFFRNCDDGTQFYFIETEDGRTFDPYFNAGVSYNPVQGQKAKFDFIDAGFASPCSIAEQAISITCLELVDEAVPAGNCENNTGEIFFRTCSDGFEYFLIRMPDGQVIDPYFGPGISLDAYDGQQVQFDFVDAGFTSPCIGVPAVTLTCVEEIIPATYTNDIPENFEDYDVIYRICRGETLRIENAKRSIQCNCPANPQGPCDNFPFNQWAQWEGDNITDNTDHVLVAPTRTSVYESQIGSYFCGIEGPSYGPSATIKYLVIVENSTDCALPNAATETVFEVTGCVGDKVSVPAPKVAQCPLGPPIENATGIAQIDLIAGGYLDITLLGTGSFSYSTNETEDNFGGSCPTATYIYNVNLSGCVGGSVAVEPPVTKVFDYTACVGDELQLILPTSNCQNTPMTDQLPVSNDVLEILGLNGSLLQVRVLRAGSYSISTEASVDCSTTIHEYSFVGQPGCGQTTNSDEQVLVDFPWLLDIIDVDNCSGIEVSVYEAGAFNFVYVSTANGNTLYFEDGSFYCADADNYDCRAAYGLGNPVAVWTCPTNIGQPVGTDRTTLKTSTSGLHIFPSPTTGPVSIQIPAIADQIQQLELFDVYGRLLESRIIPASTHTITDRIDLSDKENGIYYLILRAQGKQEVKKLVKQDLK